MKGRDPVEVVAHRAVWGLGVFIVLVLAAGQRNALFAVLRRPRARSRRRRFRVG